MTELYNIFQIVIVLVVGYVIVSAAIAFEKTVSDRILALIYFLSMLAGIGLALKFYLENNPMFYLAFFLILIMFYNLYKLIIEAIVKNFSDN